MKPTPVIQISIQRMVCTGCGAEANASCNCGKPYVLKSIRARKAIEDNPKKSNRAIAEEIGVGKDTVRRARGGGACAPPKTVVGRDDKQYPARRTLDAEARAKVNSLCSEPLKYAERFIGTLNEWLSTNAPEDVLTNLANSLHLCAEEYAWPTPSKGNEMATKKYTYELGEGAPPKVTAWTIMWG
jgi:hypothetical protein